MDAWRRWRRADAAARTCRSTRSPKPATNTQKAGNSRLTFKGSVAGPGLPRPLPLTGSGVMANGGKRTRLTVHMSGLPGLPGGLQIEEVVDRSVLYMRSPMFGKALPGGKKWARLDIAALSKKAGIDVGRFESFGQNDPGQSLGYLRAVSGKVHKVGREKVRGVSTTHYKATVDLRKYPRLVPAAERQAAKAGVDRLVRLAGRSTFPVEVWIDGKRLVRRERFEYSFKVPSGGLATTRAQVDLYDFGVPVNITPPDKSETFDATKLAGDAARKQLAP